MDNKAFHNDEDAGKKMEVNFYFSFEYFSLMTIPCRLRRPSPAQQVR